MKAPAAIVRSVFEGAIREINVLESRIVATEDDADNLLWQQAEQVVQGRPRMTGATFCERYPHGRFVLNLAHHVAAVDDGQLFDTWNSSSKCVYGAWQVTAAQTAAAEVIPDHIRTDRSGLVIEARSVSA